MDVLLPVGSVRGVHPLAEGVIDRQGVEHLTHPAPAADTLPDSDEDVLLLGVFTILPSHTSFCHSFLHYSRSVDGIGHCIIIINVVAFYVLEN